MYQTRSPPERDVVIVSRGLSESSCRQCPLRSKGAWRITTMCSGRRWHIDDASSPSPVSSGSLPTPAARTTAAAPTRAAKAATPSSPPAMIGPDSTSRSVDSNARTSMQRSSTSHALTLAGDDASEAGNSARESRRTPDFMASEAAIPVSEPIIEPSAEPSDEPSLPGRVHRCIRDETTGRSRRSTHPRPAKWSSHAASDSSSESAALAALRDRAYFTPRCRMP